MTCFVFLAILALFFFIDWVSLQWRGDCDLSLDTKSILNPSKIQAKNELRLSFDLELKNRSPKEQALLIDANAHPVPNEKESKRAEKWIKLTAEGSSRRDGYFEATLVKPARSMNLHVEILLEGQDAIEEFNRSKSMTVAVNFRYYGRTPMTTQHATIELTADQFKEKTQDKVTVVTTTVHRKPEKSFVFPIPTHLIFPHENLAGVIQKYTEGKFKPGDWVAIAESVVAIVQGRVYPVDSIHPGFWARRLNRFFQFDSSMASPYSMECAIREVGLVRIMFGVLVGLLGKLVGRSGDFYRIAGRAVATIDDATGTLPPFDKSVVLGPKDAHRVAEDLRSATGFEVAIVDANDLGKVDIIGKSAGIIDDELVEALRDNPQGNSDEQTPIVMIRRN